MNTKNNNKHYKVTAVSTQSIIIKVQVYKS